MGVPHDRYENGECGSLLQRHQPILTFRKVLNAMQPWIRESRYADLITELGSSTSSNFTNSSGTRVAPETRQEHLETLQHIYSSLGRLQPYLAGHEQESRWVEQLKSYVQRLRSSSPASSTEEQFSQLYPLRKWLFWIPVTLLQSRSRDFSVLVVLAYFYATAIALEPLFPDVGASFCAQMSLAPLEEIVSIMNRAQASLGYTASVQTAASLMDYPQSCIADFRSRQAWARPQASPMPIIQAPYGLNHVSFEFSNQMFALGFENSQSPAFPPSPMYFGTTPTTLVRTESEPRSPYLGLPQHRHGGDAYAFPNMMGGGNGGAASYTPQESPGYRVHARSGEGGFDRTPSTSMWPGGYVPIPTVWT